MTTPSPTRSRARPIRPRVSSPPTARLRRRAARAPRRPATRAFPRAARPARTSAPRSACVVTCCCARARSWLHGPDDAAQDRSEEHTSELQSRGHLVCRLLLEKKKKTLLVRYRTRQHSTAADEVAHHHHTRIHTGCVPT